MQRICLRKIFQVNKIEVKINCPGESANYNEKFVFVWYFRFTHAALAYEGVGGKYRAVFAEPKGSTRTPNSTTTDRASSRHEDYNMVSPYGGSTSGSSANNNFGSNHSSRQDYSAFLNTPVNPSKMSFNASSGNNGNNS